MKILLLLLALSLGANLYFAYDRYAVFFTDYAICCARDGTVIGSKDDCLRSGWREIHTQFSLMEGVDPFHRIEGQRASLPTELSPYEICKRECDGHKKCSYFMLERYPKHALGPAPGERLCHLAR
ncbi:MAG: hypothetical protein AAGE89_01580 [Pseudomonadota bacterium]